MSWQLWLTEVAWKGTVVLGVMFLVNYALGRASAAVRHFVWTAGLAVLLILPLVVAVGPKWGMPAPKAFPVANVTVSAAAPAAVSVSAGTRAPAGRVPYELFYLVGAMLVAVRFGAGIWRTRKMVRGAGDAAHAAPLVETLRQALGIARRVRALESAAAPVPMTWGILRPVALLPESARRWPAERLHTVLLHELVHVQRHDLLAQCLAQAVCCFYWFHPLAWLAARQLRNERERACDDAVLNRGVAPADYAGHLMDLVRSMAERQSTFAGAPAMAETSDLESRVLALLDRGRNRAPLTRRVGLAVAALACAVVLPVATLTTHAQAARGALAGVITDASGARVPGCQVMAKNLDGTNQEVAVANAAGEYTFASVPPGRYAIEVRAHGFAIAKKEIVVVAGAAARADATLELGSMTESVTVRASRTAPPAPTFRAAAGTAQRIPVGGNVQPARLLRQVRPVYPPDLRQQGITGVVMIRTVVSKDGESLNPQVINTDVPPAFAQAALDAVKQWKYQPTLLNGQPVETATTVDVHFELDDNLAGANAMPGSSAPKLILKVEPEYSDEARRAKYQGTVVLRVEVNQDGLPQNLTVLHSLGMGLDERAMEAVKKWRWHPGTLNGAPVTTTVQVEIPFRLGPAQPRP